MLSRSGETCSPSTSRSSPTFPITVISDGWTTSTSPRRKRAPPTPPDRTTTLGMIGDTIAAMDVDRFARELPELFDDFPRSEHPRGLRFDDVVEGVPNLAEENNLALVNLAASLLEPGESY